MGKLRSPTAELVFNGVGGCHCQSAGVGHYSEQRVTPEMVKEADIIFVMEESHREKLTRLARGALKGKHVVCLGIADDYDYMSDALLDELWRKVPASVPSLVEHRPRRLAKQGE